MKQYQKITTGFVVQVFDETGQCQEQFFVAGDQVDYEDMDGNYLPRTSIDPKAYFPFEMVQPMTQKR